jgi:hypothetical protein
MAIACILRRDIVARLQNEWSLLASLGETSLECKMNGHCLHLWKRYRSIAIWMLIAGIFGREIVRFAKWSLLASLGERSLDYKMVIACTFGVHRASDTYIRCLRKVMMVLFVSGSKSICFF